MAKCNYISVEVASQGCHLQTKVNGNSEKVLDAMRSAPNIGRYALKVRTNEANKPMRKSNKGGSKKCYAKK